MKFFPVILLVGLASLSFTQAPPKAKGSGDGNDQKRALPLTTRPVLIHEFMKGRKPMEVVEYRRAHNRSTLRVFRYTFMGDFDKFVARVKGELDKKGFRHDPIAKGQPATFEMRSNSGRLRRQSVALHPVTFVKGDGSRVRGISGPGRISISLNEEFGG